MSEQGGQPANETRSADGGAAPDVRQDEPLPVVVALGASAGGLAAFERFFRAVERPTGFAFVVVQHLSPEHESILPQLLSAFTRMPVEPVADGTRPLPDHVYVIPPNATLTIREGLLRLGTLEPRSTRQPISALFSSLADELGAAAVAVVLSGTGSDGSTGLHAVRAHGGLTIVQSPSEAQYDSMPRSAMATGDVDLVVPAAEMPALIVREVQRRAAGAPVATATGEPADPLVGITDALRRHTRKEFGAFKRTTLLRRVQRRLTATGIASLAGYLARIQVDGAEASALASDLMIGVTRFFRDRDAFDALAEQAIPRLLEYSGAQPVRVWVPGCATGEEAYSLAIQLASHADARGQPPAALQRFQIFATDINEAALATARVGRYPASIAADVPPGWLARYFVEDGGGYLVAREIRDACIFSVHDVLRDPPFSRMDLVSCRNLLIYIDPQTQARLLPLFHYALRPSGFLFLGSSETVGDLPSLFEAVDQKQRIFRRSTAPGPRVQFPLTAGGQDPRPRGALAPTAGPPPPGGPELLRAISAGFLDEVGAACALVDGQGRARYFAGPISRFLPTPTGAPATGLLDLAAGELQAHLAGALQAAAGGGRVRLELTLGGGPEARRVELVVKPAAGQRDALLVVFRELGPPHQEVVGDGPDARAHHLEGELRVATERWRRAVQELEGTNEELRSVNEELQTMNEELQSSNEELQLSQEELQSVNEELNTVNAELAAKAEEVNALYADLQNLFQATRIATVVLDRDLAVTRFTPAATRLYPLTDADLGRRLEELAHPFAGPSVLEEARAVLDDLTPRERILEAADGRGWHLLRALPYLSLSRAVEGVVLTFVDVTELKRAEAAVREAREEAQRRAAEAEAIMRTVPAAVLLTHDASASRVQGNEAAHRLLRVPAGLSLSPAAWPAGGAAPFRVLRGGRELAAGELALPQAASTGREVRAVEDEIHFPDGSHAHLLGHAVPLLDGAGRPAGAVAAYMDVTHLKHVEDAVRGSEARYRDSLEALLDAFAVFRPIPGQDGRPVDYQVQFLNALAQRALGTRDGRRRLRELVPAASPLLAILEQALEAGRAVERQEVAGAVGLDEARRFDLKASPLGQGEVVVSWKDVTDRAEATRALREADQRKDEFLAVLGHELRNPLAALQTALDLERLDRQGGERAIRRLDLMRRQVGSLGRLVDDLLDVTRITRGKVNLRLASVDLVDVTRAEFLVHEQACGGRLRVSLSAPPTPVWVRGDAVRIAQVVDNLLGNACKFVEPGGQVEVSVAVGAGGRPELVVRDDGVGMEREVLAHVFEPFRQAHHGLDRAKGGLGLGLSLVKGLAELMGAEVEARSDGPGRGATFRVRFAPAEPPAPAWRPEGSARPRPARRRRILVVEDNEDVRESLVEYLAEVRGHEVESAGDGVTGLEKARAWAPEVVLCDVGLPRLSGYELARLARESPALQRATLVALTGYGSDGDRARSLQAGFHHHLTKPVDVDGLDAFLAGLDGGEGGVEGGDGPAARPA